MLTSILLGSLSDISSPKLISLSLIATWPKQQRELAQTADTARVANSSLAEEHAFPCFYVLFRKTSHSQIEAYANLSTVVPTELRCQPNRAVRPAWCVQSECPATSTISGCPYLATGCAANRPGETPAYRGGPANLAIHPGFW
jgi:hypothetical protein